MVCKKCNNVIDDNANFCPFCGENLKKEESLLVEEVKTSTENNEQNSTTSNTSIYQYSSYYQNYNKANDVNLLFVVSIIFAVMSLLIGSLFADLFFVVSIILIGVTTYNYFKNKNRKNGWTIAFFTLALFLNGASLFFSLTIGKFANNVIERVYDHTGIELVTKKADYYDIAFMNDEITYYQLEERNYLVNNIIFQYIDDYKETIENLIASNSNFSVTYLNQITNEFDDVIIDGVDVCLVYNIKTNSYSYPNSLSTSEIIIINYDYEEGVLQILEVKGMK